MRCAAVVLATTALLSACGKFGIDKRDEHGMTALMRAASAGNRAEAERLIERGANVNARVPRRDVRELIAFLSWMQQLPESDIGYTPLHYAARGGRADIARLLIEKGANVNQAARLDDTPLDQSIHKSDVATMRLLTAAGARPTPSQLALAVRMSTPDVVKHLLEHGADPNARVPPDPRSALPPLPPPVIAATVRGDSAVLQQLIDAGADVNVRDHNGWTALRWAKESSSRRGRVQRDWTPIIALLESRGVRDDGGMKASALFDAVHKRDAGAVREALRAGASANARDNNGAPALFYAASSGDTAIVAALIEARANVNASPRNRTTPLIAAIEGGSVDVVRQLLAAGARVDQPDFIKLTPLQAASGRRRPEITALLLASSAKVEPGALANAALIGDTAQVRMLLAAGADPNANGGHALSEATRGCQRRDNTDVVRLLLDRGADPRRKKGEYTALHRATGLCPMESVRLLLERGADVNARDMSGVTPLVGAAFAGNVEMVRLLIKHGADVNARSDDGKSILEYAARHPVVQLELRRAGAR
jgi:ankyrin repeat protein